MRIIHSTYQRGLVRYLLTDSRSHLISRALGLRRAARLFEMISMLEEIK
jgi:hypothetical protein